MRLLLHSGGTFYEAGREVGRFLGSVKRLLFVPWALHDLDAYATRLRAFVEPAGFALDSIHEAPDPARALAEAEALLVGGGNTFRLLARLYAAGLLEPIRRRVAAGMPYIGTSAGSNVACPTIKTTNDMPIVMPPSLDALGLVPFQINPHYLDPDPSSTHRGETREQRLQEFHEMNETPVIGLREGALLVREGNTLELRGNANARLFRKGRAPTEHRPGERLDPLLGGAVGA